MIVRSYRERPLRTPRSTNIFAKSLIGIDGNKLALADGSLFLGWFRTQDLPRRGGLGGWTGGGWFCFETAVLLLLLMFVSQDII